MSMIFFLRTKETYIRDVQREKHTEENHTQDTYERSIQETLRKRILTYKKKQENAYVPYNLECFMETSMMDLMDYNIT
jgi:hypothetical protein